ncbi:MAG: hypothetical protein JW818_16205 [Pirellulales bacterium]|nr:hypothetical protein [Pirellulales bacterium]
MKKACIRLLLAGVALFGVFPKCSPHVYGKKTDPPAIAAPPAGSEASYSWYAAQFKDHGKFTPIGPAGDPADVAVSANGQLYSCAHVGGYYTGQGVKPLPGVTPDLLPNALAFALFRDGRIVLMGQGNPVRQSLMEDRLPIVVSSWQDGLFLLRQTSFAQPLRDSEIITGRERTLAWVGLDIINRDKKDREVTLLVFLSGGAETPRPKLRFHKGVLYSDDRVIVSASPPEGFTVEYFKVFPPNADFDAKDPLDLIRRHRGVLNALVIRGKMAGGQTARAIFNRVFEPQDTVFWDVKAELPNVAADELTGKSYVSELRAASRRHTRRIENTFPYETPDRILDNICAKALLDGYFLTRRWDSKYVVFDSVIYRCQWDDSSAKWINALNEMGDHGTAGRLLETIFSRQGKNKPTGTRTLEGCFSDYTNTEGGADLSRKLASWTSGTGWALWAMCQHARLYDDRKWLKEHKRQILDGCEWIIRERKFSREDRNNPCAGLIYGRYVCDLKNDTDGYFTYSDAICHLGLHETGRLLADWGHPEGPRLLREAKAYRRDILTAVDRLTDRSSDPWYVPWILHRPKFINRYFYDVCGPINLVTGGLISAEDERASHIIRWTIDKVHHGSLEHVVSGGDCRGNLMGGTCFYSQDLATTLLERERVEDFLQVLYSLTTAAISHQTLTTTEWGNNTQPHIHSISSLLHLYRAMLIQERPDRLCLLQGTPRRWLEHGKMIHIRDAPTWYGPLSLKTHSHLADDSIEVELILPKRIAKIPVHLKIRLPNGHQIERVIVNGRRHDNVQGEWIILRQLEGILKVTIAVSTSGATSGTTKRKNDD